MVGIRHRGMTALIPGDGPVSVPASAGLSVGPAGIAEACRQLEVVAAWPIESGTGGRTRQAIAR